MPRLFQVGVAMLVSRDDGKILLAKRSSDKDYGANLWELPSGRVEDDETLEEAVRREGQEELSVIIEPVKLIDAYSFYRNSQEMLLLTYSCNYSGKIRLSDEHSEMKWVQPSEAKDLFSFPAQYRPVQKWMHSKMMQ